VREYIQGLLVAHGLAEVQSHREKNGITGNNDICTLASALVATQQIHFSVKKDCLENSCVANSTSRPISQVFKRGLLSRSGGARGIMILDKNKRLF